MIDSVNTERNGVALHKGQRSRVGEVVRATVDVRKVVSLRSPRREKLDPTVR